MSTTHEHYVQQLLTHFDADPDRAAMVSDGVFLTAGELAAATRRAAAALEGQHVGRGDVVCILTEPNTAATLILRWAANFVGATAAHVRGMNAVVPDDELRLELQRAVVADVGAKVLAVDPPNEERARELLDTPDRPILAVLGAGQPDTVNLTAGSGESVVPCPDIADDDLAVITQTSGSSGLPKGVCWTFGVKNEMATSAIGRSGKTNLLITAPLTHSSGFGADDTLITGGMVALHPGFDAGAVLRAVEEYRIGRLILGTPQVYALAEHPDRPATDLSTLTELIYTGSPGAPLRLREAREIFGPVLIQVYGTTETGVLTMLVPDDHDDVRRCGTVGRPVNPDAVSVRHPETGAALPAGEVGEVCALPRWPIVGYWHEPKLTAALVRDGWVRTGDLGRFDEDGYLHLSGRLADMMKVKGIRIHPEAVERVLSQAPGVSQVAVCGVEDADRVERIYAAVVPKPGAEVDPAELRRLVAEALTDNHVPGLIEIRRELPVTGPGKPDRAQLRADGRAALARPVSRV
ncbi:fatty acid--CoA ligase family protein [Amycolatopsis sp. OK19-0408]|uniref:Fatty acid--CoA ligase family protein n=1 Tax=Amycolatopsis iheyensis TaxID=2945988 RepID=A0A9X2NHB0_9PSEU|nr:fatty acid--CoA ligase family protein [Amycolatopsis iheyensis]MCR6488761.1 fatty acid--CoA ligase family protein [Amycolatopsis iheyensis]